MDVLSTYSVSLTCIATFLIVTFKDQTSIYMRGEYNLNCIILSLHWDFSKKHLSESFLKILRHILKLQI